MHDADHGSGADPPLDNGYALRQYKMKIGMATPQNGLVVD